MDIKSMTYDVLIIGKGPAGISASLYIARAGRSVAVIGKDLGALERAEKIENYYGLSEAPTGADLARLGVAQAERLGVAIISEEVISLGMEGDFVVRTSAGEEGTEYRSRAVLLATGKQRTVLKLPGFEEFRGSGISFCATCDGFFYRGKRIAVVGSGDYAAGELRELMHFTNDYTLFTNGERLTARDLPVGLPIVMDKISLFGGSGKLEWIETANGTQYPVDGAFIAIGTAGATDFAAKLGLELNGTEIMVNGDFMTNIPGVFAAGDCIGGFLQVAKAVSDGAMSAKGILAFLKR